MLAAFVLAATVHACTFDLSAAQLVVNDLNARRSTVQEAPLAVDPRLTAIAMDRAADLVTRHYFSHVSPDGTTIVDALRTRDMHYVYAGENLALADTADAAETALWDSPEHRDNMLGAHYRHIGIAVVPEGGGGELVVQVFTD
jgi:uncharacterized protein YkwD